MSDELTDLPEGWKWTTAIDSCSKVVDCHNKTAPYTSSGIRLVRTSNIRNGVINLTETKFVDQNTYEFWSRRCPPNPGDILFTREAPMAEVGMIPPGERLCMGQRMMLLRPDNKNLLGSYLLYALQSPFIQKYTEKVSVGTGVKHLRVKDVEQLPIPLAPLNQQKRIVAKVEELRDRLHRSKEALEAVPQLCDRFRQSVLAAAFRGDLTADWREENLDVEPASVLLERIRRDRRQYWEKAEFEKMKDQGKVPESDKWKTKYKEPISPKTNELPDLPSGWEWATLDEIMKKIVDGTHHTPTYTQNGTAFISVKDIRDETVYFDDCKYITDEEHKELCKRCNPELGDLLITKSGTIGRCAIIETTRPFSLFVSVALLKPASHEVLIPFIYLAFQAWFQTINVQNDVTGSAIKNFHIIDFRELSLPIPPFEEQREIVRRIRNLLNASNKARKEYEGISSYLDRLNQSILAKAFRGELVEQDPNDEPASVLLERIRAERSQSQSTKKGGATKGKRKTTLKD